MRLRKRVATTMAGLVVATAPVIAAGALASACPGGAVTGIAAGWTRIAPPSGMTRLTTYGVRAGDSRELYASNGTAIARSLDSGCTWTRVFAVGTTPTAEMPFTSASARVTSMLVPPAGQRLAAVVTEGPRLSVIRSADRGATWHGSPVPVSQADATATDARLVIGGPLTLYLLTGASSTTDPAGRVVYKSVDDGASWAATDIALRLLASAPAGAAPILADLAPSPADPATLFAATSGGLMRSTDSGVTWKDAGIGGGAPIAKVTAGRTGGAVTVVAVDNDNFTAYVSTDNGDNWSATNVPDVVESSAVNPRQATAVVGSAAGVYQAQLNDVGLSPMWTGKPLLTQVAIDASPLPVVHACACGDQEYPGIWKRVDFADSSKPFVPPLPPVVVPGVPDDDYTCSGTMPTLRDPKDWGSSRVEPRTQTLTLTPGQEVTLPYRVVAAPKPFEVYYLTETGAKAEFSICPFETGAVLATNALVPVRNVRVGLGEFRDYPGETDEEWNDAFSAGKTTFTYLRRATMAEPGQALLRALPLLSWRLGPDAAGATALYQAVTGIGQDVFPSGPSAADILGGQQANFSPEAYKVVVLATGKWMNEPARSAGYPGVSMQEAIDELKERDVKVVGIWINNTGNKQSQGHQRYEGRDDVRRVVREAGAVAHSKLECNGDGYVDLDPGQPLVCDWLATEGSNGGWTMLGDPTMGREMEKLLLHLRDPQPVTLVAARGGHTVSKVNPPAYRGVDLLKPSTHEFDVTFRCDASNSTVPVTLTGMAGGRAIAESQVLLRCGTPLPAPKPPVALVVPPPPPVPPAPNPLPNPAPGPNPVPAPAANPAPAGQVQAQSQPVAQGVVVPQPQAQPQLAFQRATNKLALDEPMSAYREPPDRLRTARQVAVRGGALLVVLCGMWQAAVQRAEERRR